MLSVPSHPGENLGKVCENSRAGENPFTSQVACGAGAYPWFL